MISPFSNLARGWADEQREMEMKLVQKEAQECRSRQCLMVSYAISAYELQTLDMDRASDLIELIVRFRYLMVFLKLDGNYSPISERCAHVASKNHLGLVALIKNDSDRILTRAVRYVFSLAPSSMSWSRVCDPSNRMTSCYEASVGTTEHYCVDIISVCSDQLNCYHRDMFSITEVLQEDCLSRFVVPSSSDVFSAIVTLKSLALAPIPYNLKPSTLLMDISMILSCIPALIDSLLPKGIWIGISRRN